jgi:ABC-type bacteriocin/lantibiotic exporter with double-glycine peptidase domain
MFRSIQQILKILDKSSRQRVALIFFPMAATTVLELFSIALILPLIQVTVLGEVNYGPASTIIKYLPELELERLGYWVAAIFGAIFITKNIFLLGTLYIVTSTFNYINAVYTTKLFKIYLFRPLVYHFANNSALLLRNLHTGVGMTMEAARLSLVMVFDGMVMLTIVLLLFFTEPQITIIATLFLTVVAYLYYKIFSPIFRNWGEQSLILEGGRTKWILQSLSGIRDVKISNSYQYLVSKIYEICRQYAKVFSKASTAIHIPRLLVETSVVIGFIIVVSVLFSVGQSKGEIVTIMGLFGMAALRIIPSLNRFLSSASELRRLESYIITTHEAFGTGLEKDAQTTYHTDIKKQQFNNEIKISDLNYSYPGSENKSLTDLNLIITKGETVGIVGESGSGKSTLMDIILGLLEPTSGKVEVDGKNIRNNLSGWHKNFGFVPQQIFLLDDTLRRNIAFATKDSDIDDSRIREVLAMALLADLEKDLKNGLDTILGEHGTRLSGGQRQRVVIARSLYRGPDILVFDEATSAVDNTTARKISRVLETLSGNKTLIIVAHRMSTIKNCDRIVLMKSGTIELVGSYDELIKNCPEFQQLALV